VTGKYVTWYYFNDLKVTRQDICFEKLRPNASSKTAYILIYRI
jgi:hypothetical protein